VARAEPTRALLLPTEVTPCPAEEDLPCPSEAEIETLAQGLDQILTEAALDLGLSPESPKGDPMPRTEAALVAAARDGWVLAPTMIPTEGRVRVRLTVLPPMSEVFLLRSELTDGGRLEVVAAIMLRDLVRTGRPKTGSETLLSPESVPSDRIEAARSEGRAVLALSGAGLGGYLGFALQRAGGSSDARLVFPLVAIGTGLGLGASMLVTEEWDVGLGDAWYSTAGTWWPTVSALLLAESYGAPSRSRYVYSLGATAGGLALSTTALAFGRMSTGGAALTHSGGAYGSVVGGLVQMLYEGRTGVTPTRGMGWGSGMGVLAAGLTARLVPIESASRVLLVDLGAALGGLTGAAASSPLVFTDTEDQTKTRIFLSSIGAGMLAGAVAGYFFTAPSSPSTEAEASRHTTFFPWAGALAIDGEGPMSLGGGVQGTW
jgi:hypothetical protein